MTREQVLAKTIEIARETVDFEGEIRPEMHLMHDLGFDSIEVAEFVMEVEDQFDLEVPEGFQGMTINSVVDEVLRLLGAAITG